MRNYTIAVVLSSIILLPYISYGAYEISDGSVKGLYHLEDISDSSGNSNTLTNNGSTEFITGKFGNGAQFNDNTKYLTDGTILSTQTFSICEWINLTSDQGQTLIGNSTGASDNNELWIQGTDHKLRFTDTVTITGGTAITTGSWHFICITKTGASGIAKIYLNGIEDGSNTIGSQTPENIIIGNWGGHDSGMKGIADEIFITNNVLSSTTINEIYNSGTGNEICVTIGCASTSTATSTTMTSEQEFRLLLEIILLLGGVSYLIYTIIRK